MAALARIGRLVSRQFLVNKHLPASLTTRTYWNKDWKPGPYPKTQAEREAAAKKYGLRIEDYEPYPDDGMGYGDYPKLPVASYDNRSDYEAWDIPEQKRNFGEPLHADWDAYTGDRLNTDMRQRFSWTSRFVWFIAVMGSITAIYIHGLSYPIFHPVMPKQYPFKGEAHYTFEPVDD
ncbi:unnamed protein product [Owenia fusiformis]|uniref:Uncharacterized protein n=1 Tax=Owenia fusiformis TaxID=6347 RepID=A0A8J1TBS8_OWEFU|nr:unnamed protein product [Owenia fusiformis]